MRLQPLPMKMGKGYHSKHQCCEHRNEIYEKNPFICLLPLRCSSKTVNIRYAQINQAEEEENGMAEDEENFCRFNFTHPVAELLRSTLVCRGFLMDFCNLHVPVISTCFTRLSGSERFLSNIFFPGCWKKSRLRDPISELFLKINLLIKLRISDRYRQNILILFFCPFVSFNLSPVTRNTN